MKRAETAPRNRAKGSPMSPLDPPPDDQPIVPESDSDDAMTSMGGTATALATALLLRRSRDPEPAAPAARLEHPAVVPGHDLGTAADGLPAIAMKLVQGEEWSKSLRNDLNSKTEAELLARHIPILVQVAQAVAFAHSRGVIHRDLKP